MSELDQQTTGGGNDRSDDVSDKTEEKSDGTFRSTFKFSFGRKRTTESSKTQAGQQGQSAEQKDQSAQRSEVKPVAENQGHENILPTPEKSSAEKQLAKSQVPESANTTENAGPSTVEQQGQEDEHNKDQLRQAATPDALPETAVSSVQNKQDGSQVHQSLDTESVNAVDDAGRTTVQQQEQEDEHNNKNQLQQATTPDSQDVISETEESSVKNKQDESHDRVLSLGLESDNTVENAEQSKVQQQEQEDEDNNTDQLQQAAIPDTQGALPDTEDSSVKTEEHSEGQVLKPPGILESFDPNVQQEDEYKTGDEAERQESPKYQDAPSKTEKSSTQMKQSKEQGEETLDILESANPLDNTGQSTVKPEDELKENKQPQRIRSTTPEFQDALFDTEESISGTRPTEAHSEDQILQSSDVLDPLDITGPSTAQQEDDYSKKDNEAQKQEKSDGSFQSTFKFSFGSKRTTESSETQARHQSQSAVLESQSAQRSEVQPASKDQGREKILHKSDKPSVEKQVLQPLDAESDNTIENEEPYTVQQQEQEDEDNNKDQLQQAATPESQDVLPTDTAESPVENIQTEEHSEGQVLQSPDILESFDRITQQKDMDKKENEAQKQVSTDVQEAPPDQEESSLLNEQTKKHSEDKVLQSSDILESFDPFDITGQSTVQQENEDELKENKQPQRIRSTTPEFQDALFDPVENRLTEQHVEDQVLQTSDVLEFFDPIDIPGQSTVEVKEDQTQKHVSPTFEDSPTDPDKTLMETRERSEDQVLQSSDLFESFDPLVNTGQSTKQQEYKKNDQTQKQASLDFQDSPLDPTEESSLRNGHVDTLATGDTFHDAVPSPAQQEHDEQKKKDQTQNAADPGNGDPLPDTEEDQGQENKVQDLKNLEYQDISPQKGQSFLEDNQDEDYDESLLWFDTPEYLDIPQQQPGELTTEQKQTEEDSMERQDVPQDSEQPLKHFEEDPTLHTQQSPSVQKQTEDQDNSQALQWSDSLEHNDGNETHIKDHKQESSGQIQSQEPTDDMNQVLLSSDDQEGNKAPSSQEESVVKQKQADKNETNQVLLLSEGGEEGDIDASTIAEPSAVQQQNQAEEHDLGQVMLSSDSAEDEKMVPNQKQDQTYEKEEGNVSSESDSTEFQEVQASSTLSTKTQQHKDKEPDTRTALPLSESPENQDVLPHQKQPVAQQDLADEEKGNIPSESDSSEFQDIPLQEEEDEPSQSDSSTIQKVSPTLPIQQNKSKEQETNEALPLPESPENQDVLPHQKQPVIQQDKTDDKEKSDVPSESDSSESDFQDIPLHDEEDEASQSDSSTDHEVSSTLATHQHQGKEPDTSQALPLPESQEAQKVLHHPKQPVIQQKQADEREEGGVSSESDSSEFQDVPLQDEEDESSQSDSSTDQEASALPKQSQQHEDKEHDTSKSLPMSETQKDSSLLAQPTVPPKEAQKDTANVSSLPKQHEESQKPLSSDDPRSQGYFPIPEHYESQQYKSEEDDITKVLLFHLVNPEDQEPPLSEGSTDQDDTPLQYFNTSESDSSEFQDVPSEEEDVSIFPEMAQVRYQAKELKSQVPPLSEGLENQDTLSSTKKSAVQQQHQAEEQEKTKSLSDSDSLELEDVPSPVAKFPEQRFEEKGLDKSRTSVESEIAEDEGVLLSPLSPQEKHSLALEGSDDTKWKKERVAPKPDDLENRLFEANATIATLLGELDKVRGEIKERANIGTGVVKESGHQHKADTQATVRSVEIGVNTDGDQIQKDDLSQASANDDIGTSKGQSNTAMGDSGAKKQHETVSVGIQTDFEDNTAQLPAEKSEDSEVGNRKQPTEKAGSKSKTKSTIVEMMKDDRELKARFNIAENLKKALAAKSKGEQQGKSEATPSEEVVKVEEIRHLDRTTFGGKGSELGKFNRPRGVAVSSKNEIFVADRDNRRIQVHNMKGETIREILTTVPGQETLTMRPDDIAIDGNDLMWIVGSDWSTEFVIPYTMEGEPLGKFDLPDTVRFRGITVNPRNDHVIVTLTDKTFGTRGEVRVFRPDGWQLRRVGLNQGMVAPMFVTLDKDDNILVSDYGTHSVYAFDQDGKFLFKFGGYGSGVGQLKDPRGICVDGAGNIIVADFGNKRLEMFTNSGKFLRHVTDSTGRPDGIAVGPDGQLVVTEWNHTVSIIPSY